MKNSGNINEIENKNEDTYKLAKRSRKSQGNLKVSTGQKKNCG